MVVRRLQWKAAAVPDQVGPLRRTVAAAATEMGLDPDRTDHLQLAVSEALSNVILHAYVGAGGEMRVEVERDELELRITIDDDGAGLGTRPVTPGLGLGLGIIATASDRCEIASKPETGTRLTLVYELV
jgi:serine/threonine-protein kinase RsbW